MFNGWQTGFDSVMKKRATMQHWQHLQNLINQGANREAAAIVRSFEIQMEYETYQQEQRLAS